MELPGDCTLCGADSFEALFEAWDRQFWLPGRFRLERCRRCGLVRLAPRPTADAISFYYPQDDYYSYQQPGYEAAESDRGGVASSLRSRLRRFVRRSVLARAGYPEPASLGQRVLGPAIDPLFRLHAMYGHRGFPHFRPGGRALDIGCGDGAFLTFLKHHGWEVCGLEISEPAARRARQAHGVDVRVGTLEGARFAQESFDFIHMSHVLEHLHEPVRALALVSRLLRDKGLLYVETPNAAAFNARRFGPYWFPWETPRHLHVFTPSTLDKALGSASFEIVRTKSFRFRDVYRYEDTYRTEELVGRLVPGRPRIRRRAIPRALLLAALSRADSIVHPLNGDILSCWAVRR